VELWVNSDDPLAAYSKPILVHQSQSGNLHFLLSITSTGRLNFLMASSNGMLNGISLTSNTILKARNWYHVAVSVQASNIVPFTPTSANLYINGKGEAQDGWYQGYRVMPGRSVVIGAYDDSEPGIKYFKGNSIEEYSKSGRKTR
jgi:hypothetical protein